MQVQTMPAVVYEQYGAPEVLHLTQVTKPTPKPDEVLIKIHATTVTSGDWRMRAGDPYLIRLFFGLFKPSHPILGHEMAGVVEAVGTNVTKFKVGDHIFGSTGLGSGTYAEYIAMKETGGLSVMPKNMNFEEAAAVPVGALTAMHFLKQANIKPGKKVLIYGASGSVGSFAVQLAKYYGGHVTAVCSTGNIQMVKDLGADQVIDYTKTDVLQSGNQYDVIFDGVDKMPLKPSLKLVAEDGCFVSVGANPTLLFNQYFGSLLGRPKVMTGMSKDAAEDLATIKNLIEEGHIQSAIDRTYPLADIPQAHEYVQRGHKKGNVVIEVA